MLSRNLVLICGATLFLCPGAGLMLFVYDWCSSNRKGERLKSAELSLFTQHDVASSGKQSRRAALHLGLWVAKDGDFMELPWYQLLYQEQSRVKV